MIDNDGRSTHQRLKREMCLCMCVYFGAFSLICIYARRTHQFISVCIPDPAVMRSKQQSELNIQELYVRSSGHTHTHTRDSLCLELMTQIAL